MSTLYKFSSNPLSTIFPGSSGEKQPNYNNAFNITLGNPYSKWQTGLQFSTDYAKAFNIPDNSYSQQQTGLQFSTDYAQEFLNKTNGTSVTPTEGELKSSGFGASPWGYIGKAADLIGSFMPEKDEYSGEKGGVTQSLDSAYDNISNTLMAIPGWGTLAGGIMKAGALLGKGMNALGGGTSGMTTTDAILGSSFFNLTPLGLINGFGGTTSDTITKNERLFDSMGPSYSGTNQTVNDAVSKSGKKYGLFSSGALREANQEIMEAKRQQGILTNISNEASARYNIRNSMSAINGDRRQYKLQGGYDQSSVRVGRKGMSLEILNKAKQILLKPKSTFTKIVLTNPELVESPITTITLSTPEFKEGGTLSQKVKDYYNGYDLSDVTFVNDSSPRTEGNIIYSPSDEYTVHELWHYLSQNKPNEALKEFYDQLDDTKLQQFGADLEFVKRTGDPGDFYSPSELEARLNAAKFMSQGSTYNKDFFRNLRSNENKYGDNMRDLLKMFNDDYLERLFNTLPKFQNGGEISTKIVLTNPELVESPKKTRTLEELIEYAKKENPRFIQRMSEPLKFVEWEDDKGKHFGTHEMTYGEADGRIFVFPMIQEIDGNLVRYQDPTKALFNALDNKNVLQVNNEDEAKLFSESEELPDGTFTGYKSGWVDFFKQSPSKFQSGGSINVIPEGALHARKHNMDIDGITKKGIPVVSEGENGKVEQQAEIERSEVILRLEVTKKLEELQKDYYNDNYTQKQKDEFAIEAGKLLAYELLYNTIDNTNELL